MTAHDDPKFKGSAEKRKETLRKVNREANKAQAKQHKSWMDKMR
jgi:hypothetical protein